MASGMYGTLYLGVTNNLARRAYQHKHGLTPGFTSKYRIGRLAWFEAFDNPTAAIECEKKVKKWRRQWKIRLIEENNPEWLDLYEQIAG
jgi:putative endonuclease